MPPPDATLIAGGLGPKATVGKPAQFAGSLAEAMENALAELLLSERSQTLSTNDNSQDTRDRRLLFVAIARGLLRYLDAKDFAFRVLNSTTNNQLDIRIELKTDQDS